MQKFRPHPQPLNQNPHFGRALAISCTHSSLRNAALIHLFPACPSAALLPHLWLFSIKRQQWHVQEPGPTHQALPVPVFPGLGAVSKDNLQRSHSSLTLLCLGAPVVSHGRKPCPASLAQHPPPLPIFQPQLGLLLPGLNPAQQRQTHTSSHLHMWFPLPEVPSLTLHGKAYLFPGLQWNVTSNGKPFLPSRGLLQDCVATATCSTCVLPSGLPTKHGLGRIS